MPTYSAFTSKYTQFQNLDPSRFDLFLVDAMTEIELVSSWGTLKERATEMLLGHLLSISNPDDSTGKIAKEVEVEDRRYRVAFEDPLSAYSATWFGREYERLLKLATGQDIGSTSSKRGNTFIGSRPVILPQEDIVLDYDRQIVPGRVGIKRELKW